MFLFIQSIQKLKTFAFECLKVTIKLIDFKAVVNGVTVVHCYFTNKTYFKEI